ncbi:MAG: HupE/UreJ family protein [Porticoccaceae bacterium]|nr:HupE/UreJ family protein [Porticoccaceae bacterium]
MKKLCAGRGSRKRFSTVNSPIFYLAAVLLLAPVCAGAHNLSGANARFVEGLDGLAVIPYMYLGAKHMVTGYDHLLYLVGVVFFLRRLKDVVLYVSLFTLGHSITLMAGVLLEWNVNAYLIDAVIGLSVAYKAFENINGFKQVFGCALNPRVAVLIFGFFHGLGLATKLQGLSLSPDSLVFNMLSFNVGVEIGQALGLVCVVVILGRWRQHNSFPKQAFAANTALMSLGFMLTGYQLSAYWWA